MLQVLAFDELDDEHEVVVAVLVVDQLEDVEVVELVEDLGFLLEVEALDE